VYMAPITGLYKCEGAPSTEEEAECLLDVWMKVNPHAQYGRLELHARDGRL
jgi:hypothetical protein